MKTKHRLGHMANKTDQVRVPESYVNMLINNNISPCPADDPLLASTIAENINYIILVKLVDRNPGWRDQIGLRALSAQDAVGDPDEARKACDETHCVSAAIEPIFGLTNLRPNHYIGRETNCEIQPDCISRSRDRSPEDKTFGDRPTLHGKMDDDRKRHAATWKRPTPHVLPNARFETSCVE